jgi:drug/metabolite transporter (DMT)-like permease
MTTNLTKDRWLLIISFAIIYLVWGSTYLANWYAIQDIPPLLMSGSRFFIAGLTLFVVSYLFGATTPTRIHWKNASFSGIMFLTIGTGGMVWAEQYISSGMTALLVAFQPLLVVLLMWQLLGKRPTVSTIFGTILGMVGMTFLVGQDQFLADGQTLLALGVIFISLVSWGVASIQVAKIRLPESKLQSAGMQMLTGGGALLMTSIFSGEAFDFQPSALTARSIWSWFYLVIFGSIVAFSAFNYLLIKSSPDKVATSNYVNPVVALLLGWGLNSEEITEQSLLAAILLLTGVVFINTRFRFFKKFILPRQATLPFESLAEELPGATKEVDIRPTSGAGSSFSEIIARIWHGTTSAEKAPDYIEWTKRRCIPDFAATPGNLGVTFLHRTDGDLTYHTVISYWQDYEAVKRYAGEDYGKPRFYPEEKAYLVASDQVVAHRKVSGIR